MYHPVVFTIAGRGRETPNVKREMSRNVYGILRNPSQRTFQLPSLGMPGKTVLLLS